MAGGGLCRGSGCGWNLRCCSRTHAELPLVRIVKARTGVAMDVRFAATFGLLATILALRWRAKAVPMMVGFITAAYWFTASTSFANPAVTIAAPSPTLFLASFPDMRLVSLLLSWQLRY